MAVIAKLQNSEPPRRRRRRLKSVAFVPTLMTLGNLVCGFAAIHFALRAMFNLGAGVPSDTSQTLPGGLLELLLPSFLSVGAGLVVLGGVFDALDGLLARVTRSTTDFGGQLDSLADVVTFGVAPATLMVAVMTNQLSGDAILPSPISAHLLGRFAWVSAAVFVAFAAIRLARYNVEHAKADFDYRSFRGLPTPGAGLILVAMIIFHDDPEIGQTAQAGIVYTMPVVALLSAFLMVSRVPYKRLHRTYLLGRRPFEHFVGFVAIVALFSLYKAPVLVLLVLWYWLSGPVGLVVSGLRRKEPPSAPLADDEGDEADESERLRA
jgi:CDP-diacylglycerol--serine O-phosphatidyltransferase